MLKELHELDLSQHRSQLLSQEDVDNASLIIPVTRRVGALIHNEFSNTNGKVRFLRADIPDPWRQPVAVFRVCAQNIDTLLEEMFVQTEQGKKLQFGNMST